MKDPTDEILDALYSALSGNVSYDGNTVPVYTVPPPWEDIDDKEWIQLGASGWNSNSSPKDKNLASGNVEITVYTQFTGTDEGSQVPVNTISSSVMQLIDQVHTLSSFTMVLGRIESAEVIEYELDPQGVVVSKLINFNFITEET